MRRQRCLLASALTLTAACGDSSGGDFDPVPRDAGATPPEIVRFEPSNATVEQGSTVFLGWETANAETVTLRAEPGAQLLADSLRVNSVLESSPLVTPTTFTLVATGPEGTAEASVTVDVIEPDGDAPPRIIEFFVEPSVYQGRRVQARVSWTAIGQLSLTRNGTPVEGFSGEPFGAVDELVSDSRVIYELRATRAGITEVATGTITRSEFEVEPNDQPAQASVPSDAVGRGRIDEGDRDLWLVEVPDQGRITAFADDGVGGCPFDTVLELFRYDPDAAPGAQLAFVANSDDASPTNPCARIDPVVDPRASSLPAGLYVLRLSGATEAERGQYRITILVEQASCGNGTVEFGVGEACDDGNSVDGDGCSAACAIEPVADLVAPQDASVPTPALEPGASRWAVIELAVEGAVGASLDANTCEPGALVLRHATLLEGADYRPVARSNERCAISARALPAGRYLIELRGGEAGLAASELDVFAAPFGCGDGLLVGAERCDDGNTANGDGCSDQCRFEWAEDTTEPLVQYRTTLPEDGYQAFRLRTVNGSLSVRPTFQGNCTDPTVIRLFDNLGRPLGSVRNDDECATMDAVVHEFAADIAGEFTVTIESLAGAAQPEYELRFLEPNCGNGILERRTSDEECDDGAPTPDCDRFCNIEVDATLLDRTRPDEPVPIMCSSGVNPGVPRHRFDIDPEDEVERVAIFFAAPAPSAIFSVDTGNSTFLNEQLEVAVVDPQLRPIDADVGDPNLRPFIPRTQIVGRTDPNAIPDPVFVEIRRVAGTGPIIGLLELNVPCFDFGRCGDAFLELGEQCDDGNELDGDGCSRFCDFEIPNTRENEGLTEGRNDSRGVARELAPALGVPSRPVVGSLFPPGDVDYYQFDIPNGEAYSLRAFVSGDPTDPTLCRPEVQGPIRLALLDDGERELVVSDPDSGCATADGASGADLGARDLPGGRYYLRIDRPDGGQAMSYSLFLALDTSPAVVP